MRRAEQKRQNYNNQKSGQFHPGGFRKEIVMGSSIILTDQLFNPLTFMLSLSSHPITEKNNKIIDSYKMRLNQGMHRKLLSDSYIFIKYRTDNHIESSSELTVK